MIDIEWEGIDKTIRALDNMAKKQVPFATMMAINETANDVKAAEIKKMKRVFNKPTKTTLNSVIIRYAKKISLWATVKIKDKPFSGGGAAVKDYLGPQIHAGERKRKGSEMRLQSSFKMTKGRYIVPGQGMKLNKFGNIPKGKMTQIMSAVGGHHDTRQNVTARSKKLNKNVRDYFVVKKGNPRVQHLHPGIYRRIGRTIRPMLLYVKKPRYFVRFRFFHIADTVIGKKLVNNFNKALDRALRTAR